MTSILGSPVVFQADPEKISNFLSDMRNFKLIMPEQAENWSADETTCAFTIKNLGNLSMKKGVVNLPHQYEFPSTEDSRVSFTLVFHFQPELSGENKGYFEIFSEMNPLVEMMARRPLTNFVNILTENFRAASGK